MEEALGKSLPIIILRNKIKKELRQHEISSQLSNEYVNRILDTFQVKDVLLNERVCHPGLKHKELIFIVIQGAYETTRNPGCDLFGLDSLSQ